MKAIHLLTSLDNLKSQLKKTNSTDDRILEEIIMECSSDFEEETGYRLRGRTYGADGLGAEYINGAGTNRIYTNQRPIISVASLYDDTLRAFGSSDLKASTDYFIWYDEGIIELEADAVKGSTFTVGRQNVKLIYTAGYDRFEIIDDINDRLDFTDSSGAITANLTGAVYTSSTLATHIKTVMDTASDASADDTYTVTYDYYNSKFTIVTDGTVLTLSWDGGSNSYRSVGRTLGFDISADDSGALTYTSDYSVLGIPTALEQACIELCLRRYLESHWGGHRFDVKSKSQTAPAGGTTSYVGGDIPPNVKRVLDKFRKIPLL